MSTEFLEDLAISIEKKIQDYMDVLNNIEGKDEDAKCEETFYEGRIDSLDWVLGEINEHWER